jgi:hypothetical protein
VSLTYVHPRDRQAKGVSLFRSPNKSSGSNLFG